MDILTVDHVSKYYAAHTALYDVSFAIPKGSVSGLLVLNGAVKTTLSRIIKLITAPDQGKVYLKWLELQPKYITNIGYIPVERVL